MNYKCQLLKNIKFKLIKNMHFMNKIYQPINVKIKN